MTPTGSEHPSDSTGKTNPPSKAARNQARLGDAAQGLDDLDDDLAEVVEAWPALAAAIKAGILALVKSAKG